MAQSRGERLSDTPSQAQIGRINGIARVDYFPALVKPPRVRKDFDIADYFRGAILGPLTVRIREDLGQTTPIVGIRGTACSLDGDFEVPEIDLKVTSLERIMQGGSDTGEPITWAVQRSIFSQSLTEGFAQTYLIHHTAYLRRLLAAQNRQPSAIFPLLLLYKKELLRGKMVDLPKDPVEREEAIIKGYVLDYPVL